MNVLITGGAGYLGGKLAKALTYEGHFVRIFDIMCSKYVTDQEEFIQGDIRDPQDVKSALEKIDIVYHLAFVQTPSNIPVKLQEEVNIKGTQNLLEAVPLYELRRFIFVSTIEVYGSKPTVPIREMHHLNPVGVYSKHKIHCENLCVRYYRDRGLPITIARLPLVCGEGYYNHKLFLSMLDRILDNKTVYLPSPGTVMADMIHIDDAIEALNLVASHPSAKGDIFHFSASAPASHLALAKKAIECTNSKSKIVLLNPFLIKLLAHALLYLHGKSCPHQQIDYFFHDFILDNTKAHHTIGYKPKYDVLDAFIELVKGYARDREYIRNRKIGVGLYSWID